MFVCLINERNFICLLFVEYNKLLSKTFYALLFSYILMISIIKIFCCMSLCSSATRLGISSTQINKLLKFMESFRLDLVQLLLNLLICWFILYSGNMAIYASLWFFLKRKKSLNNRDLFPGFKMMFYPPPALRNWLAYWSRNLQRTWLLNIQVFSRYEIGNIQIRITNFWL